MPLEKRKAIVRPTAPSGTVMFDVELIAIK